MYREEIPTEMSWKKSEGEEWFKALFGFMRKVVKEIEIAADKLSLIKM